MSSQYAPSDSARGTPSDHNTAALPACNTYDEPTASFRLEGKVDLIGSTNKPSLTERLSKAFESWPLADGEEHPADDIIAAFLSSGASEPYPCELETIVLQGEDTDLVAATLQCTARFEPPWSDERKANLVRYSLRADDVCVRDAAVRAAESWPCPDVITELERHQDSVAWLQEYIDEVIADANQLASIRGTQD